ncbi:MAG TPA: hypothetical protein VIA62_01475 [Thermoanaerobaculia bacterium]|jgi:hypothetical protein|nr:hypothetical protein [Thermoanaerobaculia bacterium]
MKSRGLKFGLALSCGLLAVAGNAAPVEKQATKPFADADHVIYMPVRGGVAPKARVSNLTDHGGGVVVSAKVAFIFWGPSFNDATSADHTYATTLQAFRSQFGTTPEYNVITQYGGIQLTNLGLGTADMFDTTTPPTNVTDAIVQGEVNKYLSTHAYDPSTIYEVVIPRASYSSSGTSTSCSGPHLSYCAYHGAYTGAPGTVLYSIEPYPSCSGCAVAGWSDVQNQEHFVCHETREAVTDPVNGWWDGRTGQEADDKCAWSPSPFIGTSGFAYQYEWSNLVSGCVKTR